MAQGYTWENLTLSQNCSVAFEVCVSEYKKSRPSVLPPPKLLIGRVARRVSLHCVPVSQVTTLPHTFALHAVCSWSIESQRFATSVVHVMGSYLIF